MTQFQTEFSVEWGDCDAAGIVFYPNYFYWLDSTFQRLLRSRGLGMRQLEEKFGAVTPLVDVGMTFKKPVQYDQRIKITVEVAEWEERRFRLSYRVSNDVGVEVATGHEVRAWAISSEGKLKGATIPEEFRTMMK